MSDSTVVLSLSSPASQPDRLAALAADLAGSLVTEGFDARPLHTPHEVGTRGDSITIGQFVLALVSGGTLQALIQCLQACLVREKRLTIKLTASSGEVIEVDASNVDGPEVRSALRSVVVRRPDDEVNG